MDYGQIIAQDLAEAEAFANWKHCVVPASVTASPDTVQQLALLRQETSHLAAMTTFNASVANWLVWHPGRDIEVHHQPFKPSVSAVAADAMRALGSQRGCFELACTWQAFSARLTFAIDFAETIVPAGLSGPINASARELLSDVWQRASAALLDVHGCLVAVMGDKSPTQDNERETSMLEALRQSADGGWPCITPEGQLQVPGWADRRRARRRPVSGKAVLLWQGARFPGMLLDATPFGLKIAVDRDVPEGADLTIILPNHRQHAAAVVWSRDRRIGVKLSNPLDIDALLEHERR